MGRDSKDVTCIARVYAFSRSFVARFVNRFLGAVSPRDLSTFFIANFFMSTGYSIFRAHEIVLPRIVLNFY